jgi:hypothetical protein
MSNKIKDWTNQKFGRLTIVKRLDEKKRKYILWEAVCDCGNCIKVIPTKVSNGSVISCGCYRTEKLKEKAKDWAGLKFNRITLLKRSDKKNKGSFYWDGICECGNPILAIPSKVASGEIKSCGCFCREKSSERFKKLGEMARKDPPKISSAKHVWRSSYKDGDIDFEDWLNLTQQFCYYCGRQPLNCYNMAHKLSSKEQKENGNFVYNGLDRIDSSLPHNKNNVVPCCYQCNWAKSAMPQKDFFDLMMKIYEKHLL